MLLYSKKYLHNAKEKYYNYFFFPFVFSTDPEPVNGLNSSWFSF